MRRKVEETDMCEVKVGWPRLASRQTAPHTSVNFGAPGTSALWNGRELYRSILITAFPLISVEFY